MKRNKTNLLRAVALSAALVFALSSCNKKAESPASSAASSAPASSAAASSAAAGSAAATNAAKPTDAQIASIAVTGNQIDVDYAKIAEQKATNPDVKKFAQTMDKDHSNVIKQAVALATKLKLTPDNNNPTTISLNDGAVKEKAALNSAAKGAAFDKAYIDNEVAFHTAVIGVVENTLIPDAQNAELKALLQSALPLFKSHLDMAKKIQASLNK